jgi:hypothetical protein
MDSDNAEQHDNQVQRDDGHEQDDGTRKVGEMRGRSIRAQ